MNEHDGNGKSEGEFEKSIENGKTESTGKKSRIIVRAYRSRRRRRRQHRRLYSLEPNRKNDVAIFFFFFRVS